MDSRAEDQSPAKLRWVINHLSLFKESFKKKETSRRKVNINSLKSALNSTNNKQTWVCCRPLAQYSLEKSTQEKMSIMRYHLYGSKIYDAIVHITHK